MVSKRLNILLRSKRFLKKWVLSNNHSCFWETLIYTWIFRINGTPKRFNETLVRTGIRQFINKPTHKSNHIVDLLITREDEKLIQVHDVDPDYHSDHHIITCTVKCAKPSPPKGWDKILFCLIDCLIERLVDFPYDCDDPNVLAEAHESIIFCFWRGVSINY